MFAKILLLCLSFNLATSALTFRNVMVTCDSESPSDLEVPFSTIVTTNRLKPHLPNQKCYKISVQYATVPILYSDSVSDITNANFLLLENDSIEQLEPGAFKNTKIKEALSLKSNKLREIRRGVFNDVQVPVLFLSYNYITYIDYQAFDNMTTLESVHLDHNQLSRIDTFWFQNTPRLSKINLQHNLIQEVPANAFRNLVRKASSSSIDLSHNSITSVNRDAFLRAKKLKFLSLSHNRLDYLDRNWLKDVKVDVLDISSNRFTCLRYGLAAPYSTNLVDKNPWSCACLREMKGQEMTIFGSIVADEDFRRCNIGYRS